MSLVGDLIIGLRDLAPDPCQVLNVPTMGSPTTDATAPTLFSGGATVTVEATQGTPWGETNATSSQTATSGSAFNVDVTVTVSYLATFVRVYFSIGLFLDQYVEIPITTPTNSVTVHINGSSVIGQGLSPTVSRAYLPDTDGNVLSCSLVYRWLNEGLMLVAQETGGIRDVTGVPSNSGQAQYQTIGRWMKFDNQFFDGYPFPGGNKAQVFRHSNVVGLTGVGVVNTSSDRQIIELWPQPNRTSGQSTLTSAMGSTDTSLSVNTSGFVLGFGLLLVGTYPPTATLGANSCELIYYSNLGGTSISQLTRGLGGTQPQAWPIGTNVQEVNVYLSGMRSLPAYARGQSALTFSAPPAFEEAINIYLLHRFKKAEQQMSDADSLLKSFMAICERIKSANQPMGPRQVAIQVGGYGMGAIEVCAGLGSVFGGVILP